MFIDASQMTNNNQLKQALYQIGASKLIYNMLELYVEPIWNACGV